MAATPPPPGPPPPPQPLLIPKPDPDAPVALLSTAYAALTPQLCDLLRRELEPSAHDHPDLVRQLRLSQSQLDALSASLLLPAATPPPLAPTLPPPAPIPAGSAVVPSSEGSASSSTATRKRARGGEMVRITNIGKADDLQYRSLLRRARITFEALRGIYYRDDSSVAARNRADLRASSQMLSRGLWLHRDVRVVGSVPGVVVGDAFFYRAELCVVGLHGAPQAGISFVPASLVSEGHPIATSIVSSGGYLDDEDSGDVLLYTGSGGRQRNRLDHSVDQTLQRGNLALHNNCRYGVEVRVIRCHPCEGSPSRKVYVYDGLYKVVNSTYGPGKSGHAVCKYTLVRIPGQDELGSRIFHAAKSLKDALDAKLLPPSYLTPDLSQGAEPLPVPVSNSVDGERSPLEFEYIAQPEFPALPLLGPVRRHRGCHCAEVCGPKCGCVKKNTGGPAYGDDGTLVRGRPVVYECGALCGCTMSCPNRVTQRRMSHRLEVFRSEDTDWGVRTLDLIQPGAFVCEFSGDVLPVDDAALAEAQGAGVVAPRRFPARWMEWGNPSDALPDDNKKPQFPQSPKPGYVLGVSKRRNLASYISHSCNPNLFVQFVVRGNENESFPHLMVFAMDTIPPVRELSLDYGI